MEIWKKHALNKVRPGVPELERLFQQGKISRRDFMRSMALLGVAGAAAACVPAAPAVVQPTTAPAAAVQPTAAPAAAVEPKVLRIGMRMFDASAFDVASTARRREPPSLRYDFKFLVRLPITASAVVETSANGGPLPSAMAPSMPASVPPRIGTRVGHMARNRSAAHCSKSSGSSLPSSPSMILR